MLGLGYPVYAGHHFLVWLQEYLHVSHLQTAVEVLEVY